MAGVETIWTTVVDHLSGDTATSLAVTMNIVVGLYWPVLVEIGNTVAGYDGLVMP